MAKFFIDRPVFAWVIAILIMLSGVFALNILPISQYPNIAPPQVAINVTYPGASAKILEETVTQVIEQKMKGLDNLLYMYSTSDSSGSATINFAFKPGTNVDIAQVQVQNKLQLATPLLPEEVQRQGISVAKSTRNYLLVMAFVSEDGSMTDTDIADYVTSNVQDTIGLLQGVGDISSFGSQYAMRIWLNPDKLEEYHLNPSDVIMAIQEQNAQVAGGQVGASPARKGQEINVTVNASSRFQNIEEFGNVLLRTNTDGSTLRLKDVSRIELNSEMFSSEVKYNGMPASGIGIRLASGANALETANIVKNEIDRMSKFFPSGLKVVYAYDTTPFVELSIASVFETLIEGIVLVFLVMLVFLQSIRATIIPTIAVPVVLLGTFGVLAAFGFSINSLTMFGMVLAIGLLVDDAIVVVENVERIIQEEKLSPKEATKKSMEQIVGALVGVALVISAVFVPMAFMGGSTGIIFRQFSITIVSAMLLSLLVAVVLTPALCATVLKAHNHEKKEGLFAKFNKWFGFTTLRYQKGVRHMIAKPWRYAASFAAGTVLICFLFTKLPTGFLPNEDQGTMMVSVQLPSGASMERTGDVLKQVEKHFLEKEAIAVKSVMTVAGFSFSGNGQNAGFAFVRLSDWSERDPKTMSVFDVANRANMAFSKISEAMVFAVAPPAVSELGQFSGFDMELIDRASQGHAALMAARNQLLGEAAKNPSLRMVRPNGLNDVEQYELDIDVVKAGALGLSKGAINRTIGAYWGSAYVNDFMHNGRSKKVYLQSEIDFRMQANDFYKYHIRNDNGDMVPFSSFLSMHSTQGSPRLERYNGLPSMEIVGEAVAGKSSGQAMEIMEELVKKLPDGFDLSWTGMSYQEKMAGSQSLLLYAVSLIIVFLCLAALYESWAIPFSVLLAVPTGMVGAVLAVQLLGLSNDIYFQVGLLTVVGLSAKNSILIVEFAKDMHENGMDLFKATTEAVKIRLRPIIMTSLAFILGVLPLLLSNGAGSGGQNAIGATVVYGMITATGLGIFMTPILYVIVTGIFSKNNKEQKNV